MSGMKFAAVCGSALIVFAMPAGAATWLTASSDADFAAQNTANVFTTYGTAMIQWGSATTWEHAITDGTGKVLQSGDVKWSSTNTLGMSGSTALLSYTSAGKLTSTFVAGSCPNANGVVTSCKYTKTGTVAKGADTLWIRGVMPDGAFATSVYLMGLEIKYTGGVWTELDFLDATSVGAYVGFSDPNLSNGFSLRFGGGSLNNLKYTGGVYNAGPASPSFEFIVGNYATPPEPNQQPGSYSADPSLLKDFGGLNMRSGFEMNTAAVPEPASWAMLLAGFGVMGGTLRRRRVAVA